MSSPDRQLGVDLYNATWKLIESRTDDDLMLQTAHASLYHWAVAPECRPENHARGHWLLSRVYTLAGRPEPALYHARRCLECCTSHAVADWDLAVAYEALARASRLAGDDEAANGFLEAARAVPIADLDDREHIEGELATV